MIAAASEWKFPFNPHHAPVVYGCLGSLAATISKNL